MGCGIIIGMDCKTFITTARKPITQRDFKTSCYSNMKYEAKEYVQQTIKIGKASKIFDYTSKNLVGLHKKRVGEDRSETQPEVKFLFFTRRNITPFRAERSGDQFFLFRSETRIPGF